MRLAPVTCLLWLVAAPLVGQTITSAEYGDPTTRYPHGVLGDNVEYGSIRIVVSPDDDSAPGLFGLKPERTYTLRHAEDMVFEDIAPRLWDIDGDGKPEVVTVESQKDQGARLAIYKLDAEGVPKLHTGTSFIGQRFRWLAPVGVADFNGDGALDIALVDRPHLARRLWLFQYREGDLTEYGSIAPVTNHRIGDNYIEGGVRDCGAGPEIIVMSADWTRIMAVAVRDGTLKERDLAPYAGRESVRVVLGCD